MKYRQKQQYLAAAGGSSKEAEIIRVVMSHISRMDYTLQQWKPLWGQVKQQYMPDLNVIYQMGTEGENRSGQIWTSKPMSYVMKLVYFYYVSMFPEDLFLTHTIRDRFGRQIPKGKVSPRFLQHLQDLRDVCIFLMERGRFFEEVLPYIAHFLLLGNSAMKMTQNKKGLLVYRDTPVDALAVQRDSNGEIWGFAWKEQIDRWQLVRDYGQEIMQLFTNPTMVPQSGQVLSPVNRWMGLGGGNNLGGINYGNGSLGTATGSSQNNTEDIAYLHVPNASHTGIPGAGVFDADMEYVTYVVAVRTQRLLDVWTHPTSMYGVSSDLRTMGENYSRGLAGRLLADTFALNEHRKATLRGRGMVMQSPYLVAGPAPSALKKGLQPFQMIKVDKDTKVEPLFQPAAIFRQQKDAEDMEVAMYRESMGVNNVEVETADRMTASEYMQRKDGSWSQFHPIAKQIYTGLKTIIQATQDHAYLSGMIAPPPPEMLLSGLDFEIELRSVFSFGAKEKGSNLVRALAPFQELFAVQPELLDHLNFVPSMKSNLSDFQVVDALNSQEEVEEKRRRRAQMAAMEKAGQSNQDPVQRGMDRNTEMAVESRTAGSPQGEVVSR